MFFMRTPVLRLERQMVVLITDGVDLVQLVVSAVSALAAVASVWVALYISRRSKWPDVVAYLEADRDSGTTDLVVRNIGDSPAYDVRVGFGVDYTLVQPVFQKGASGSFVRTGIPMLVPGSERRTTVFENCWGSEHATDTCEVEVSFGGRVCSAGCAVCPPNASSSTAPTPTRCIGTALRSRPWTRSSR